MLGKEKRHQFGAVFSIYFTSEVLEATCFFDTDRLPQTMLR